MPAVGLLQGTIRRFLTGAPSIRVLVAGDCMLDAYVAGTASRISPEAPVPVVDVSGRRYVPGGAANVAANARSLGATVRIAGVIGADDSGVRLRQELERQGICIAGLVKDSLRVTTTKTRITAAGQQIVRFDEEDRSPLSAEVAAGLRARMLEALDSIDVCVVSDYAKGVVDERFSGWLIAEAARRGVPVVVDPKSPDLSRYRGATLITPNLREASVAAAEPIHSPADLARAVGRLLPGIAPSALLVTQGEGGMSLFEQGFEQGFDQTFGQDLAARHLPALVNEVADVTGAGDTVVAALAVALGMRLSLYEAAEIANIAAGVAVSHHGTWAVKASELLAYVESDFE